jgi:hypothetical protein
VTNGELGTKDIYDFCHVYMVIRPLVADILQFASLTLFWIFSPFLIALESECKVNLCIIL